MSQDVLSALQAYLASDGKSINVPPQVSNLFGQAIGSAIQQLFSGGLQVDGANFALTGDSASATISGTGAAAPLLSEIQVTAIFTATDNDVTLAFNATIQSDVPISNAWPSQLNFFPFTDLVLTSGSLTLNVDPGATTFDLAISPTVTFEGTSLGTGLIEVTYDGSTLGYLGGFMATGTWTPFKDFPVLSSLQINGEFGAFLSTFKATDLSAFKSFPFVPDEVDAGFTVLAMIELENSLAPLQSFLPSGSKLELTAIIPQDGGLSKASVVADISEPTTNNAFVLSDFKLAWQSTSADSGTITLAVTATVNISSNEALDIIGSGIFTYGTSPSLTLEMDLKATGGWLHPFGIPQLTILEVAFSFTLSDEGIGIAMAGIIQIGQEGSGQPVLLTAGAGFEDFEVPDYVAAELSAENPTASVTLSQLIHDFVPQLPSSFPLLDSITFTDLKFWAVAAPVTILGKSYSPGIGASGAISFFGYDLDFGFNLMTNPTVAVQAQGTISQGGQPIVISGGGITWLTISGADGTGGASACIDTTGSGFCSGMSSVPNAYFAINAKVSLLGLVSASVLATASADVFEMELNLSAGGIFTDNLSVGFDPKSEAFNGSIQTNFNPPDITLGPWGCIPSFTIPTPKISLSTALGTVMPTKSPFANGWMPSSAPYFYFDLEFSFVGISFGIKIDLDINQVTNALQDFGSFLVNWLEDNASKVLDFILQSAELLTRLLLNILEDIVDLVKTVATMVANQIGIAFEDAYKLAGDIWDGIRQACSVVTGSDAMSGGSSMMVVGGTLNGVQAAFTPMPRVLADLAGSEKGNALLYHYYLNRHEVDSILRYHPDVRERAGALVREHVQTPRYQSGIHLPLVIDLIQTAIPVASPEFQESAREVIAGLEPHAGKNYNQLLETLHAQ